MNNNFKKVLGLAVVMELLPGVAGYSYAQSSNLAVLEEVIVTAQKREESLQDTPISIAVVSEDDLEKFGISSISDMAISIPNMDVRQTTNGSSGARVFIRGIGSGDHVATLDGSVGVYMDGVYIARNTGLAFEIADLQRIEVLRGPQGSLWGRNTTGGAISLVSEKPSGELGIKQSVDVGNYNHQRSNTQIHFPTMAGVNTKLSLLYQKEDGSVENKGAGPNFGQEETFGTRFALQWQPADNLLVDYAYDFVKSDYGSNYYQPSGTPNPGFGGIPLTRGRQDKVVPGTRYRSSNYRISGHGLTLQWDINELMSVKSITAYRELEQENYTDNGANPVSTRIFSNDPFNVDQHQFSQEFQLLGSAANERVNYTLGLYYFDETVDELNSDHASISILGNFIELNIYDRNLRADNRAWAAFGQTTWTPDLLQDRLHLTAGGRYSVDKRAIDFEFDGLQGSVDSEADDRWRNFSPSFVAAYDMTDNSNIYIKYIEGYKTGGYNGRAVSERQATVPVDEEQVTSIEAGYKSELLNNRIRLNAAVFKSQYDDIQLSLLDVGGPPGSVLRLNAGEATIDGVEIDVTAAVTENLSLKFGYAYLDNEFVDVKDPETGADITDDFLAVGSPENSYNLDLEYFISGIFSGDLTIDLNYGWKDTREVTSRKSDGLVGLDSYGIWNGRITLNNISARNSSLSVALWGKNLTDEEYILDSFQNFVLSGLELHNYGDPRSYGVEFIYRYQ